MICAVQPGSHSVVQPQDEASHARKKAKLSAKQKTQETVARNEFHAVERCTSLLVFPQARLEIAKRLIPILEEMPQDRDATAAITQLCASF